jgi:hypothetical protein
MGGRKLASLANGVAAAGSHLVEWDPAGTGGARVPGGACFCRIRAAGLHDTIRMLRNAG